MAEEVEKLERMLLEQLGPRNDDPDFHGFVMHRFRPSLNEDGHLQFTCTYWPFRNYLDSHLSRIWPFVKSVLEQSCAVSSALDVVNRSLTLTKTSTSTANVSDALVKAVCVVEYLSVGFNPYQAVVILDRGRDIDIIKTGHQVGGICSKYGISKDQYVEQQSALRSPEVRRLIRYSVFLKDDLFLVSGKPQTLRFARMFVMDCIVNKKCIVCPEVEKGFARSVQKDIISINIGHQEGGVCSTFGITKAEYIPRRESILLDREELSQLVSFTYLKDDTVFVVGTSQELKIVKRLIEDCIVRNKTLGTALLDFKEQNIMEEQDKEVRLKKIEAVLFPESDVNGKDGRRRSKRLKMKREMKREQTMNNNSNTGHDEVEKDEKLERLLLEQIGPRNDDPDFHGFVMDRFRPSLNEDGHLQFTSTYWPFSNYTDSFVTRFWPFVKYTLEKCAVSSALDLVKHSITLSKTSATMANISDALVKAVCVVELLSMGCDPFRAVYVLEEVRDIDIIKTGHQVGGICSKYGISKDQYVEQRRSLLSREVQMMICWGVFLEDDLFMVSGGSEQLRFARRFVMDCIVHKKCIARDAWTYIMLRYESAVACKWNREVGFARGEEKDITQIIIGHQGGLCSEFGITKAEYIPRRDSIILDREELSQLVCATYIKESDDVVFAVGTAQELKIVKRIIEDCIVRNKTVGTALSEFKALNIMEEQDKDVRLKKIEAVLFPESDI